MNDAPAFATSSRYLEGAAGRLFSHCYTPLEAPTGRRVAVIHVPAFAEEMNKARAMIAAQARWLAALGMPVLLIDLFGTGDSAGDFGEATWDTWKQDVLTAMDWMRTNGADTIVLWGLRLGALLALDVAAGHPRDLEGLLLWQPVLTGRTLMTQFLRLRTTAAMMRGRKEGTEELRRRLHDGAAVEVAGYELNPHLFRAIDGLEASRLAGLEVDHLWLFEFRLQPGGGQGAGAEGIRRRLPALERAQPVYHCLAGMPFWSTQEILMEPELLELTSNALRELGVR